MAKSKSTKGEKVKEKEEDVPKDTSIAEQDPPIEAIIEIKLNAIENIITKNAITVALSVKHNDVNLGECNPLTIDPDCEEPPTVYEIEDFVVQLPVTVNYRSSINPIVSTPVLITLMHSTKQDDETVVQRESQIKKKTKFTVKSGSLPVQPKVIGICSLDLMPILLGSTSFTEKLILETPQFSFNASAVSWKNLPLLTVTVTLNESEFFPPDVEPQFLTITVESIYNLPQSFNENSEYAVGTVMRTENESVESVIFEGGSFMKHQNVERAKRWQSLSTLKNRAQLSKYKIDCDNETIKNEFKHEFDPTKKLQEDIARIEWNSMYRYMLLRPEIMIFKEFILKYRFWPFELAVGAKSEKSSERKSEDRKHHLYQFYVDLAELLFPGKTKTRVLAQLHTHNLADLTEKTGLKESVFASKADKRESKLAKTKGKTATKYTESVPSEGEVRHPSVPLQTDDGQPVLILVEFELDKPLIPARTMEDFNDLLAQLSIPKEQPSYPYSSKVAEEHFVICIQNLIDVITESYRDFREESAKKTAHLKEGECEIIEETKRGKPKYYCNDSDELTNFSQYLLRTGVYQSVRATLKSKVVMLLDQKYRIELSTLNSIETQNFITSVFTNLTEQMHIAINKIVEGRPTTNSLKAVSADKLYLYAEEAQELGNMESAKRFHLSAIAQNKTVGWAWIKYAIYLLKVNDVDRAIECLKEAITLNSRCKIGLLMYGVILAQKHSYREAGIFLRAIAEFYPRFAEGWCILHLFYIRTEYYPGMDLTITVAEKCMKDKDRETSDLSDEPLAWSTIHCPPNNIYTITAILLLKLHLCDFASIALAEDLSISGRSTHVMYYMAVEHYLSNRPEDALSHLEEARYNYGMDYSISSLMGHCYLQLGNFDEAIKCYEFADMIFDRPDDLHLVHLRMGLYYEDTERYDNAKKAFLNACKFSPTALSWLGAGIALFHLSQLDEAELALSEANQIDNQNAEVWGYLCLLNMYLGRQEEFTQCYREMIKNNLRNAKLWLMITNSMEALGYVPPISTISDTCVNVKDTYEIEKNKSELGESFYCEGDTCVNVKNTNQIEKRKSELKQNFHCEGDTCETT